MFECSGWKVVWFYQQYPSNLKIQMSTNTFWNSLALPFKQQKKYHNGLAYNNWTIHNQQFIFILEKNTIYLLCIIFIRGFGLILGGDFKIPAYCRADPLTAEGDSSFCPPRRSKTEDPWNMTISSVTKYKITKSHTSCFENPVTP